MNPEVETEMNEKELNKRLLEVVEKDDEIKSADLLWREKLLVREARQQGIEIGKKQSIELEKHTADLYYEQGRKDVLDIVINIILQKEVKHKNETTFKLKLIEDIEQLKNSEAKK